VVEAELTLDRFDFKTQARLQEHEDRRGRPGLGSAGDGVESGALPWSSREAAEQFGQPMEIDEGARVEHRLQHLEDFRLESVAREPVSDQGVVVRPDRAVVVGHGIVAYFSVRQRANSPSGKRGSIK